MLFRSRDFFDEFLTSREGKARFLRQTLQHSCHGDPTFTFSDVGRALQTWLAQRGVLAKYGEGTKPTMPAVKDQPHVNQALLNEFKAAYRSQKLRPVRGFFFARGKRVDMACPLVALALHRGAVDQTEDDGSNTALEWAVQTFGEHWTIGLLDGFDRQEKARNEPDYMEGYELGTVLAQDILPGERIC